ncbi:MAG: hypothetical protein JWQ74_1075 [Marmoricola sp.]|nr:hypothetical protein [Marmoricola sp.]
MAGVDQLVGGCLSPEDPRHGKYAGERAGCRCAPCRRARYLYNIRMRQDHDRGIRRNIPAIGTQRRIQALQAMGWTLTDLQDRTGMFVSNLHRLSTRQDRVLLYVYQRIAAVYDELCMTPGPSSRMRAIAKNKGYAPPLAWDDIDNDASPADASDASEVIDDVAIQRRLAGDRSVQLDDVERAEAVRRHIEAGGTATSFGRLTGIRASRYPSPAA